MQLLNLVLNWLRGISSARGAEVHRTTYLRHLNRAKQQLYPANKLRAPEDEQLEKSEAKEETIIEWWDNAHAKDIVRWLSGYQGAEIWRRLEVEEKIRPGLIVLNIGVGLGHCTRALFARGCQVTALDISAIALRRIADIAQPWNASEISSLPAGRFDLALSHLVTQHMLPADLSTQLRGVISALKPDGVFAMQFRVPTGDTEEPEFSSAIGFRNETFVNPERQDAKFGSVLYHPETLERMVVEAGGRVTLSLPKERNLDLNWAWHVVHIQRSNGGCT
jgi:SAM-dependent methyltransferase